MPELSLAFLKTKAKLDLTIYSGPYNNNCQILASNDLLAVSTWYNQFQGATLEAYQRVGQRLLLWCSYIKGLSLANLIKEDFEEYLGFLQKPPKSWCLANAYRGAKKHSASWRPFVAGLAGTAFKMEVRIINSLMNYLVQADYLRTNPLKLIRISSFSLDLAALRLLVWVPFCRKPR